jgi:hypothetical protein
MTSSELHSGEDALEKPAVSLRLYVARSTPNSMRAEHNLSAALDELGSVLARPGLEVIDVFAQPKRAITDSVMVTPTLIATARDKRVVVMGDLADRVQLAGVLKGLMG